MDERSGEKNCLWLVYVEEAKVQLVEALRLAAVSVSVYCC